MKRRIRALCGSFRAAANGVKWTLLHERNMRIHMVMAGYVLFFAVLGRISGARLALLFVCFAAVMAAELFNTALERLCDTVKTGFDRGIALIKDISSGAVLVAAIFSACAGLAIFLSPDVFGHIVYTLFEQLWILCVLLVSIPCALFFIFKKS